jgi:hypothetical protein
MIDKSGDTTGRDLVVSLITRCKVTTEVGIMQVRSLEYEESIFKFEGNGGVEL